VVDSQGAIYGRLVEGDPKTLAGKMCDKVILNFDFTHQKPILICAQDGNVWNDGGTIVGRAELVPESEREGQKEGPFAGFDSAKVTKDGKVADAQGVIIGRLIDGDAKKLFGKEVDADVSSQYSVQSYLETILICVMCDLGRCIGPKW
jgi:hypothetical protein